MDDAIDNSGSTRLSYKGNSYYYSCLLPHCMDKKPIQLREQSLFKLFFFIPNWNYFLNTYNWQQNKIPRYIQ